MFAGFPKALTIAILTSSALSGALPCFSDPSDPQQHEVMNAAVSSPGTQQIQLQTVQIQTQLQGQTQIKLQTQVKSGLDLSHPYGYYLEPILEKIKATPDQRKRITKIVFSYKAKIQPLRDQYKQTKQEFWDGMLNGHPAETVMTKEIEMSHLESDIVSKYCLMRLEIRKNLKTDQIIVFEQYCRQQGWMH
jgi:hypothetical protein